MAQRDAMQAIDRAKSAIEDAEQYVSELEDDDLAADERPSLSRSQIEHRIEAIQSRVDELKTAQVDDLASDIQDVWDDLNQLYLDV